MRQICLELWIENKQLPVLLVLKGILLFTAIFSGILIKGYPYGCIAILFMMPLLSISALQNPQIEYLVPRTDQDRKKAALWKAAITAGIYTAANETGYILTVLFCEQYQWDGEMWFVMTVMAAYSFLLLFSWRVQMEQRKYMDVSKVSLKQEFQNMTGLEWVEMITPFMAEICIFLLLLYKFARFGWILFLGREMWRIVSLAVIGLVFILLCTGTRRNSKKIVIQDYYGRG